MVGEIGTDVDEAAAVALAGYAVRTEVMELRAFIGNHIQAKLRARNAKQILTGLGLGDVPVGAGEQGFGSSSQECEEDPRFLCHPTKIGYGRSLLRWSLENAEDGSVVLVLNSGFTDAVWLWMDDSKLFLNKVKRVVIMGGIEMDGSLPKLSNEGFFQPAIGPGGAANNNFDGGSTLHMYHLLQQHGIPTTVTTRFAAYGCKLPYRIFDKMSQIDNPIGQRLAEVQNDRFRELWSKAIAPAGHPARGDLPGRCDRSWFVNTFCGGNDPGKDDVVRYIVEIAWYDPMNLVAGVDTLREQFYDPYAIEVKGVEHQIIGLTAENHGVRNPEVLRRYMQDGVLQALSLGQTPIPVF
jgi:hypothetical protein